MTVCYVTYTGDDQIVELADCVEESAERIDVGRIDDSGL